MSLLSFKIQLSISEEKVAHNTFTKFKMAICYGKFVLLVLCCYFAFKVYSAFQKLQSEQIGTIFRTVNSEKTVQGMQSPLHRLTPKFDDVPLIWTNVIHL